MQIFLFIFFDFFRVPVYADRKKEVSKLSKITIAQRVRHLRKMKGFTREQLARLTATEPSTISRYESGTLRNPSVTVLQKICDAVGITLPDFFLGLDASGDDSATYPEPTRGFDAQDFCRRAGRLPPELRYMLIAYLEYLEYLHSKEAE